MSSYIRKLSYLYYYENRKRGVNAGYVKLERRDMAIRFQMNIRFRVMDDLPLILYLYGKQKNGRWVLIPLGNCQIKNRQLIMRFIKKENEVLPDGITIEDIYGVFLPLKGNRCFAGSWNDRDGSEYFRFMDWVGTKEETPSEDSDTAKQREDGGPAYIDTVSALPSDTGAEADSTDAEAGLTDTEARAAEISYNKPSAAEAGLTDAEAGFTNAEKGGAGISSAVKNRETGEGKDEPSVKERDSSSEMRSMEWTPPEQAKEWLPVWEEKITPELVFSVYPSLPEFLYCKKCIRIEPQDIGILPMESWFLASNSFLLHGYYNFNHLLLGWKTDKPEAFILGVPGIYDRREKIMAGMFGFESFEIMGRRDPEKSPIPEGAMGYWYRSIEPSLRQENK